LKELEDYKWFPNSLRSMQMDYIGFLAYKFNLYRPLIPIIHNFQKKNIVDVCSGSGWPAYYIHTKANITLTLLTDLFIQKIHFNNQSIYYKQKPVNVFDAEYNNEHLITMYNAFHHFNTQQQLQLLQKWQEQNISFLVVEVLEPTLLCFFKVLIASTLGVLLLTPFIQPFNWKRLLFTYIIPINIFTILIDGIISVCKSNKKSYFENLLQEIETNNYTFSVNRIIQLNGNLIIIRGNKKI
jgi:hypothetical protein